MLFTVLAVPLPGFALWRLIGGYGRNLVEDLSAGWHARLDATIYEIR